VHAFALIGGLFLYAVASEDPEKAEELLAAGRLQEARAIAEQALADPDLSARESLRWRWIAAESWWREGDYEEAADIYEKIADQGSDPVAAHAALRLARCRLEMWDPEGAERALLLLGEERDAALALERDELAAIALYVAERPKEARERFEALGTQLRDGTREDLDGAVEQLRKSFAELPASAAGGDDLEQSISAIQREMQALATTLSRIFSRSINACQPLG